MKLLFGETLWILMCNVLKLGGKYFRVDLFKNIKTKVLNILFVEKINNFNSWNILVTVSNLPFLNINLEASFFFWVDNFLRKDKYKLGNDVNSNSFFASNKTSRFSEVLYCSKLICCSWFAFSSTWTLRNLTKDNCLISKLSIDGNGSFSNRFSFCP